ncbi:Serine/threonine-protein kinase PrkC [Rosistilla carotiformis]|uniref:Serine/threonine-protein kinase PrkC n=1 Tax=Rosistilla carotiformis TaxID=2528017 RepID=A0A518JTJ6_9BACT|nr:serine/threonine-protein kinase [Rosistilla carotiformis]QDV68863.1 Serine/threonine-protein kinase PrkC [Rosistilla carotiformis]
MSRTENSTAGLDDLSAADQTLLVELLDQYLIASEEGRQPDIETIVAQHPHLARPLRDYLSGLNLIQQVHNSHVQPSFSESDRASRLVDYELGEEIGRGAMGIVYAAIDKRNQHPVALKILAFGSSLNDGLIERFAREARAAQSLSHPNIVPVYDIGCDEAVHYYSMQRIDGDSLDQHIAAARARRRDAADTASGSLLSGNDRFRQIALRSAEIADALHQAHQNGIVHRDIKPSNVLRDRDGKLWLTDFGLVRIHQEQSLTKTGDLIGTYRYMSPEQARGRVDLIGPHTDVYGLGATLYEMLALRPLFRGDDSARLLRRIDQNAPKPPSHWDPRIPRDLETIVLKAIRADHTQRYATAAEFADDLTRFAQGQRIHARRESLWIRTSRILRQHARTLAMIAAGLTLLIAIGLAATTFRFRSTDRVAGSASIDPTLRLQVARLQLAELVQADGTDAATDTKYRQLIDLLNVDAGRIDEARLRCRAENQWAAACLARADLATAELRLQQAVTSAERLPEMDNNRLAKGLTHVNMARLRVAKNELSAARNELAQAQSALARPPVASADASSQLIVALNDLCMEFHDHGATDAAISAAADLNRMCDWDDTRTDRSLAQLRQASIARNNLGALLFETHDFSASANAYDDSIALFERMLETFPWNMELRREYAIALNNLGRAQAANEAPDAAEVTFQQAIAIIDPLSQSDDKDAELAYQAGGIWNNLSVLKRGRGDLTGADAALSEALKRARHAVALQPQALHYRRALNKIEQNLKSAPIVDPNL